MYVQGCEYFFKSFEMLLKELDKLDIFFLRREFFLFFEEWIERDRKQKVFKFLQNF